MRYDRVGRVLLVFLILVHLEIARQHGLAHEALGIRLSGFQRGFVGIVVVGFPLVAAIGLWTRASTGFIWALLISMLLSLGFGVSYHYLITSSDNVMCLPKGRLEVGDQFSSSAAMLAWCESTTAVMSGFVLLCFSPERREASLPYSPD